MEDLTAPEMAIIMRFRKAIFIGRQESFTLCLKCIAMAKVTSLLSLLPDRRC